MKTPVNFDAKGQEKILDIVGMLDGDAYVNAIGGNDYYSAFATPFHAALP